MSNSFTNRPGWYHEESFSGHIMRVAIENGISIEEMLRSISIGSEGYKLSMRDVNTLYSLPYRNMNVDYIKELLKVDDDIINKSTFSPIYFKFLEEADKIDGLNDIHKYLMQNEIERNHRRYCPYCIKEVNNYKLLWLVKEITICDKHLVKLKNTCPKCGHQLPYFSEMLGHLRCDRCGSLLYLEHDLVSKPETDLHYIAEQLRIYEDWRYLLDVKQPLFCKIENFSKEKSVAIRLLYAANLKEGVTNDVFSGVDEAILNPRYVSFILALIRDKEKKKHTTIASILKVCRKNELSIYDFAKLDIPKIFVKSVVNQGKRYREICLSPWCESYGKNTDMAYIKDNMRYNTKHFKVIFCRKCYVKFGYNMKNGVWEEVGDVIKIYWDKVRTLVEKHETRKEICKKLNLNIEEVTKAIGFLCARGLVPIDTQKVYFQENVLRNNVLQYFKDLVNIPGNMIKNAITNFGWTYDEYYYYYYTESIQKFLLQDRFLQKTRKSIDKEANEEIVKQVEEIIKEFLANDIDISQKDIANKLNRTRHQVEPNLTHIILLGKQYQKEQRHIKFQNEVKKQVEDYLNNNLETGITISCKQVFIHCKIKGNSLLRCHRDLVTWIDNKVDEFNKSKRESRIETYKVQMSEIVKRLFENGAIISMRVVANELEMSVEVFRKTKELKEEYYKIINQVNSLKKLETPSS